MSGNQRERERESLAGVEEGSRSVSPATRRKRGRPRKSPPPTPTDITTRDGRIARYLEILNRKDTRTGDELAALRELGRMYGDSVSADALRIDPSYLIGYLLDADLSGMGPIPALLADNSMDLQGIAEEVRQRIGAEGLTIYHAGQRADSGAIPGATGAKSVGDCDSDGCKSLV